MLRFGKRKSGDMLSFSIRGRTITIRFGFCMMLLCLFLLTGDTLLPCLVCCMLHECGHLAVCLILHLRVRELEFGCGRLTLRLQHSPETLPIGRQLLLHGGGILSSLLFAAVAALLSCCGVPTGLWVSVNLCLAAFHLIPAPGLDGGRLWMLIGERLLPAEWVGLWEFAGQGIAFWIFALFAAGALMSGEVAAAIAFGLLAVCCICRFSRTK